MNGEQTWHFDAARINTQNTHGTGCTLSSAITAFLARGYDVSESVKRAKSYVQQAISGADQLDVGHGHGPVNHFAALWNQCPRGEGSNVETER